METYGNESGNSGVAEYEIGEGYIRVRFKSGVVYRYNHDTPGADHVEKMKDLATAGKGLSAYIGRYVGDNYADKES